MTSPHYSSPSAEKALSARRGEQQQAGQQSFVATGEQISAVQYRKVQFKWYTSRELHEKPLGPNQWKTYWTLRGDDHDVVEVDVGEDLELEDDSAVCVYDEDEFSLVDVNQDLVEENGTSETEERKG